MPRTTSSCGRRWALCCSALLGVLTLPAPVSASVIAAKVCPAQRGGGRLPAAELREHFLKLDESWKNGLERLRRGRTLGERREAAYWRLRESFVQDFESLVRLGGTRSAAWLLSTAAPEERADPEQLSPRLALYRRLMEERDNKWLARSPFIDTLVDDAQLALGFAQARNLLDQIDLPDSDHEVRGAILLGRARLLVREAADEADLARAAELRAQATGVLAHLMTEFAETPPARRGEQDLWRLQEMLPGRPAPALVSTDIDGNETRLEDLEGQVVLLHFFSFDDWGVHHRLERDAHLIQRYWDESFVLLGVNRDEDKSQFRRRCAKAEVEWPVLWEGDREVTTAEAWHLNSEAIVLVDRKGQIVAVDPSSDRLQDFLDALVRNKEPTNQSTAPPGARRGAKDGSQDRGAREKESPRSSD